MTRRAMQFIDEAEAANQRWCCHLSFIKPHWPYIVPAPYHAMYDNRHLLPVMRHDNERQNPHPVYEGFMNQRASQVFSRDGVRDHVLPAYMGLIKQIDDQIGLLMASLEAKGLLDNTMIVFSSDHGDYLGDHWMGEKDMFHQQSVRVPLIIYDPRGSADATRGIVNEQLVEGIDLLPTFVEACGGDVREHVVEGRSLAPLIAGGTLPSWREAVFSEYDYAHQPMIRELGRKPGETGMTMIYDGRFKLVQIDGYRPILHDLMEDSEEFFDLGGDPDYGSEIQRLQKMLLDWALSRKHRVTKSNKAIEDYTEKHAQLKAGIYIGYWDEEEVQLARREAGLPN